MSNNNPYGSITKDETAALVKENTKLAMAYGKQKYFELQKYAEEGNYTWKVLGFFAGLTTMVFAFLDFFSNVFAPAKAIVDIYIFAFGAIACVLEYKEKVLTQTYLNLIKREALFLYRPYGRAAFYAFIGLIEIAQGGLIGFIVGAFSLLIGVIIFQGSMSVIDKLKKFKEENQSDSDIKRIFNSFDKDNSGSLDTHEIAALCQSLGSKLSLNELESAIFLLDKNGDGTIQYDEFLSWYRGKDELPV